MTPHPDVPDVPGVAPAAIAPDAHVLDVREPDEWAAGHVPGAQHVPLGELAARAAELPEDRELVVVCRGGGRSSRATAYLRAAGRQAVNLEGGMQAWAAAGKPMQSETGSPPSVI